jgi:hypothetical protein
MVRVSAPNLSMLIRESRERLCSRVLITADTFSKEYIHSGHGFPCRAFRGNLEADERFQDLNLLAKHPTVFHPPPTASSATDSPWSFHPSIEDSGAALFFHSGLDRLHAADDSGYRLAPPRKSHCKSPRSCAGFCAIRQPSRRCRGTGARRSWWQQGRPSAGLSLLVTW